MGSNLVLRSLLVVSTITEIRLLLVGILRFIFKLLWQRIHEKATLNYTVTCCCLTNILDRKSNFNQKIDLLTSFVFDNKQFPLFFVLLRHKFLIAKLTSNIFCLDRELNVNFSIFFVRLIENPISIRN